MLLVFRTLGASVGRRKHVSGGSSGLHPSEFRATWTEDGEGTVLRQNEDGTCVFLGPQGCEVHRDRPLVCRLYPLGRTVRSDGSEYFIRCEGHPQSAGGFTDRGTIADYLAAQGALPFMAATDAYFQWLCAACERLGAPPGHAAYEAGTEIADLLDLDTMIARHCEATGAAEPGNLEDRMRLHVRLLHEAIAKLEVCHDEERKSGIHGAPA